MSEVKCFTFQQLFTELQQEQGWNVDRNSEGYQAIKVCSITLIIIHVHIMSFVCKFAEKLFYIKACAALFVNYM